MLTNILNLPEPVLRACEREVYSKGDARYSATELIKPARMGALQRLYGDAIVEDVADHIQSLFGRVVHMILQLSGAPETGAILEERLYAEVGGVCISGAMDHCLLYPNGKLADYKTAMCWSVMQPEKFEWEAQTNIYAWLEAQHDRIITELEIVAFLKDWTVRKARTDTTGRYPKQAVVSLPVMLWPLEKTQAYLEERVAAHQSADQWAEGLKGHPAKLEPYCTDAERWTSPTAWALMKKGNKRATKIYGTRADAELAAASASNFSVEERLGEARRCMDYCSPGRAGFCTQWNEDKVLRGSVGSVDMSAFE